MLAEEEIVFYYIKNIFTKLKIYDWMLEEIF